MSVIELLESGAERIVAFALPGELIGLESCTRATHRYGAQAASASTLCRLRWGPAGLAARGPGVLRALVAKTAAQLEHAASPWPGLPAVERVRAFVEDFGRRSNQPLPMTRAQIGQHLGLAEETVVRALKRLQRRG
jgi:CRP/FNR family transcriptional regulator, anaerobic regulatory protein